MSKNSWLDEKELCSDEFLESDIFIYMQTGGNCFNQSSELK